MTRLVVEEGGSRRAFNVGEGKLTIGSGEGAKLRLESADVAVVHAELEVRDGVVTLHVRPGVVAPKVGGRAITASTRVDAGVPIVIGSATLRFESDKPRPSAGTAPRAARVERGVRSDRPARKLSRGLPTWAIVAPVFAILGSLGFFVMRGVLSKDKEPTRNESRIYYDKAKKAFDRHQIAAAQLELGRIPLGDVSAELRRAVDELRTQVNAAQASGSLVLHNMRGTEFLEQQIKRFDRTHLKGVADRPKVRVFLKRIDQFKQRWPEHEEMAWIRRQERRFSGLVDLTTPPNFDDIAFEVRSLTWATDMRNYKECFAVMERFLEDCTPQERTLTLSLVADKRTEREEWFEERMQRARFEYETGQIGRSVAWLVALIRYSGDEQMEDRAATDLVRFDNVEARLRGYKEQKPETWADLKANTVVNAFIAEKGLDGG